MNPVEQINEALQNSGVFHPNIPLVPVDLKTRTGQLVTTVGVPRMASPAVMPEIIAWGDRFFIRQKDEHFDDLDYREGWVCVVDGSIHMRQLPTYG